MFYLSTHQISLLPPSGSFGVTKKAKAGRLGVSGRPLFCPSRAKSQTPNRINHGLHGSGVCGAGGWPHKAQEAQEMVAAAVANNVALMEAMWSRFLPHYAQVREIVASGILGKILTVHADHGQRLADQNIPRLVDPSLAGGALLDLGIYPVSFAHMILGNPTKIIASGVLTDRGVDGQTSMIFDYASGAQAVLNTTMLEQTPCRAIVAGVNGWLEIDRVFYSPTSMRVNLFDGTFKYALCRYGSKQCYA